MDIMKVEFILSLWWCISRPIKFLWKEQAGQVEAKATTNAAEMKKKKRMLLPHYRLRLYTFKYYRWCPWCAWEHSMRIQYTMSTILVFISRFTFISLVKHKRECPFLRSPEWHTTWKKKKKKEIHKEMRKMVPDEKRRKNGGQSFVR